MAINTGQLVIGLDGAIVSKTNGYITSTSQYTNYIQVVAPFPDTDSVSINFYLRNARISNYTQYMSLQRDDSNVPLTGKDVIDSTKEYYQSVKDWNVWLVPIDSLALAAISKYHAGTVDVSVTYRSFKNLEIEETGTYIGTFGSRKSITGGDLPETATIGDFYKCDYLDYYSDVTELEFTLADLAIYTETGWIKGIAYETRLSTGSTEFGVDPAIFGQAIEDTRLDTTEMIIDRIAGLEAAVLNSDSGGSYADNLYIRNGLELNYSNKALTEGTDTIYLERDNDGYHITIADLTKGLDEVESTILRTPGAENPYTGAGFYASDDVVLIGSADGPGISWDGSNLYLRGTIQSGTITDPTLLAELKGDTGEPGEDGTDGVDGETPIFGVDYFNGEDGISYKFIATLAYLSDLTLISNPSKNDSYRITETEELWLWSGTAWKNMGIIRGLPGTDGENGLSTYLHIAYATADDGSTGFSTTVSTNKTYIGSYSDFTSSDSTNPALYKWSLIKGSDGSDGLDGVNGVNAYLHIAYANSSNGQTDFSTSWFSGAEYIGTYTNSTLADSETYTDYDWSLIKGSDGSDGLDGTDGVNAYLHIAYANSSNGDTDFSTTVSTDKTYIGTYTNSTLADSETYTDYTWSLIKGSDGSDGLDGTDGVSAYLHIAYATSSNGDTGFSTTVSTDKTYIGQYTNSIITDSEIYTDYTWTKIIGPAGQDGIDGLDGNDGLQFYLHIAYATNSTGTAGFSTTDPTGKTYIGTYTDTNVNDSVVASLYTWVLFKGTDGLDGQDGTSVVLKGSVPTVGDLPTTATVGDLWVVEADGDGYVWNGSTWTNAGPIQGPAGQDGIDGLNAYVHFAYSTSSDGQTNFNTSSFTGALYIGTYTDFTIADSTTYTDYEWSLFKGLDGQDGENGLPSYIHYAYATSSNGSTDFNTSWFVGATYVGWYTNFTITDSETYTDYEWSLFKGSDGLDGNDGLDGENGLSAYIHYAYATSSTGNTGFSTTYTGVETYVGWLTDFNVNDSTNYGDYTWSLFKGLDGSDGLDGENGLPSYIHYAYSNSSNGSTDFSTSWFSGATYVGWYTDFTVTDSETYTDYDWSIFKGSDGLDGLDGENGLPSYVHYAYATNSTGTTGFSTTYLGTETYIGWYSDFTELDSSNYSDYEWSLFKGADGTDGIDGLPAKRLEITGKNAYKFLKDSTTPTYTSITLTAQLFSTTGYDWEYSVNGGSTWISLNNTTSTYTNNYDDAIWSTLTSLMIKCSDSTGLATDIFSIYKLYDGDTGIDSVSGYLTDENRSFVTNSVGEDYDTVGYSGTFKVFYGLTDKTTSSTFSITSTNPSGGMTLSIGASTGIYTLETDDNTWTSDEAEWTLQAVYGGATITKVFKINKAKAGTDGPSGPGLTYVGTWVSGDSYYANSTKRDVVEYIADSGNYYACILSHDSEDITNTEFWEPMTGFKSVATDILLAGDATITKGLVIGSSVWDTESFIRSAGATDLTSGNGFYMGAYGTFRVGNSNGKQMYWDGSNLQINGSLYVGTEEDYGFGTSGIFLGYEKSGDTVFNSGSKPRLSLSSTPDSHNMSLINFDDVALETFTNSTYFYGWSTPDSTFYFNTPENSYLSIISGATPTTGTGPTSAYEGEYYIYLESSGTINDTTQYRTMRFYIGDSILTTVPYILSFAYHMYGVGINKLEVWSGNGGSTLLKTISGNQGNEWHTTSVDIPTGSDIVDIRFYQSSSYTGDIAVDAIKLVPKDESYLLYDGTNIALNGNISGGSASFLDEGIGYYLDKKGTFRVGDPDGNNMTWDGSALTVIGDLSASTGSFGTSGGARTELDSTGIKIYNSNNKEIISSDTILQQGVIKRRKKETAPATTYTLIIETDSSAYKYIEIPSNATITGIQLNLDVNCVNKLQGGTISGDSFYYTWYAIKDSDTVISIWNSIYSSSAYIPSSAINADTSKSVSNTLESHSFIESGYNYTFKVYMSSLSTDTNINYREWSGQVVIQYTQDVL